MARWVGIIGGTGPQLVCITNCTSRPPKSGGASGVQESLSTLSTIFDALDLRCDRLLGIDLHWCVSSGGHSVLLETQACVSVQVLGDLL